MPFSTPPRRSLASRALWVALLCCLVFGAAGVSESQVKSQVEPTEVLDVMAFALQTGDVDQILANASGRVDLLLDGNGGNYSSSQARRVMHEFFQSHPAERVSLSRSMASSDAASLSGRYWLEGSGNVLSVSVAFRIDPEGKSVLQSLRISEAIYRRTHSGG